MNPSMRAFVKEALALQTEDDDTPPDYLATRIGAMRKLGMAKLGSGGIPGMGMSIPKAPTLGSIGKGPGSATSMTPQPIKPVTPASSMLKIGSTGRHLLELAGLGVLAAPATQELRGKHVSDKKKQVAEVAGLGMLAAPYAHDLAGKSKTYSKATGAIAKSRIGQALKFLGKPVGH